MTKNPPLRYIILRQDRQAKAVKNPDGGVFQHIVVDFLPILSKEPLPLCDSPEQALSLARKRFPAFPLLAVQPESEYLSCHSAPKLSRHSPTPSEQRPGK